MKRRAVLAVSVLAISLLIGAARLVGLADSHHLNWRYLSWKWRLGEYDQRVALRYMHHDDAFRQSLVGKTKQEIRKWFPTLRSADQANPTQRHYAASLAAKDYLWIDDSTWYIAFADGMVESVCFVKG